MDFVVRQSVKAGSTESVPIYIVILALQVLHEDRDLGWNCPVHVIDWLYL